MGILVVDKYRGKGYSYPALMELEKVAFEKNNINVERKVMYENFCFDAKL